MIRLRRITALAVCTMAALPAAASAAVTCPPTQTGVNAWAGSPKTLTFAPCTSALGPVTYTVVAPLATKGTATAPAAGGSTFVFTGTLGPNGVDPTGADTVNLSASDGSATLGAASIPISIGAAPVTETTFAGNDIEPDTPLQDGRRTFTVFYKTTITATSNLTDPTPATPLSAFSVRFRSGIGVTKTAATNLAGNALFTFRPLVTDEYAFDVPALPGSFIEGYVFSVAPDWKITAPFPVRNKKYVISGRLLAGRSARTKGSYVRFQRKRGTNWITVVSKVPVSSAMTFSVKVSKSAYTGKTVRFLYFSKNDDYIHSIYRFTIKAGKPQLGRGATGSAFVRSAHR